MSYLAIARKYRPATFDEIVGQDHVTRTLRNAIASGRIHHAYLFCGARGVGKTTAARALAKSLNCEKGPTPDPCGECTSCREIASGSSPDLIEIDGASNNSVDDVRDLRETVHYAPTRGRYKVYLVDEVHMLSKAAFNALLKTLEEPPPHVVFIFATTEPNRILDTILSRVQRFDFKRIPVAAVVERLDEIAKAEGVVVSEHALRLVARAGEGSMRDAQSLLDKVISFGGGTGKTIDDAEVAETLGLIDRTLLFGFLQGLVAGEPDRCLDAIGRVYDYGHELSQFTSDLLELVRNATFVRLSDVARHHVDISSDELERLDALVDGVPVEALTRTFNALLDVHDQVSRAARPRIVLEMAVARLATKRAVEPVAALLARLEDLERRLRTDGAPVRTAGLRSGQAPSPRKARAPAQPRPEPPPAPRPAAPEPAPEPPPTPRPPPAPRPAPAPRASRPQQRDDSFGGRWSALQQGLRALGGAAARLAEGQAKVRNGSLIIAVPAGRALAEARRAKGQPEVQGLVHHHFPGLQAVEAEPLAGTGTPAEHQQALQREVLEDPDCKRIIQTLGAEIDAVTSLRDDAP